MKAGKIMKKTIYYSVLALIFGLVGLNTPAQAGWLNCHEGTDFAPYLENAKQPQNAQFRKETWKVEDWAPNAAAGHSRIDQFFRAGVLADFTSSSSMWHDHSTLSVGPGFYHLSRFDKTRVVTLFDHLYGVTSEPAATLYLEDQYTGKVIGVFTRWGLQLQ